MVKVGFICEGLTEVLLIESDDFQKLLKQLGIQYTKAINAKGNKNLISTNIKPFVEDLESLNSEIIFVLTDLDSNESMENLKKEIIETDNLIIVIAVKQVESWFLADSTLLTKLLGEPFEFNFPENEEIPFETLRKLLIKFKGRGIPAKVPMALKMLNNGFSIQNAANHPNCPSAKYFLTKLQSIEI